MQQRHIEVACGIAHDLQGEPRVLQRGLVVVGHLRGHGCQAGHRRTARAGAPVGLGEEEHVAHDAGEAVQIFEVGRQHFGHLGAAPRPHPPALLAQGQLVAGQQGGQRRAQLVRHVGVEALHLRIGLFQPAQERVELLDQRQQFGRLACAVEPLVQRGGGELARLRCHPPHGRQAQVHQREAAQRYDHGAGQGRQHQRNRQAAEQLLVGLHVHAQLHLEQDGLRWRNGCAGHLEAQLAPGRQGPRIGRLRVYLPPIGPGDLQAEVLVPRQKIVECMATLSGSGRVPIFTGQQVPQNALFLPQRIVLPRPETCDRDQVDHQADSAQPRRALHRKPPRQPAAQ